ncbi:MAG: class I SAM-dependent methyltransferase [Zoogloeaceae bacterium]|jgi:2-polyprenyl-6-hydroxyphenyl methylase/3-demethylubiquinone-9 3-methyltransferase|nr:class I SAM-dependent methyltransferase [Zoogloeaceae bacterium]
MGKKELVVATITVRSPSSANLACKICHGPSVLYGVLDFNHPCEEQKHLRVPLVGIPIYYRRCETCGFLFTDAFDDWSLDDFKTHIYNGDYQIFDPHYCDERPNANAGMVMRIWGPQKTAMRVLDYGGGNGVLCTALRAYGFKEAVTYDPMVQAYAGQPNGRFDLVTCFETLEHLPDPMDGIGKIVKCVADPGAVLYSTLIQPDDIHNYGVAWWYVGPRNGHISIFTKQALEVAWAKHGFKTVVLNPALHLAYRNLPPGWNLTMP